MVDLSLHGVVNSDKFQFGYDSYNLGELFYMQISASISEKSILFNIVESMHDAVTQMLSIAMFPGSVIRINTIWNH